MRITGLELKNFKRFTDLKVEGIPASAKLVLLIGANGSGKSSVFDAFNFLSQNHAALDTEYFKKNDQKPYWKVSFENERSLASEPASITTFGIGKFIGRSSIRIVPRLSGNVDLAGIAENSDGPLYLIDQDDRFHNDVAAYMQQINEAIREPIFKGLQADVLKIFRDSIQPLNVSLKNIFGSDEHTTIQINGFEDPQPQKSGKLIFRKGDTQINYDLLSHGEKQVVILLLNFIVRKQYYEDAIIYIDEMDAHLNTALQQNLLGEIVTKWIPDSAQLWTATHALGFIDYARKSDEAVIIDFNGLDFDQPQVLRPVPKENFDVFEIAVSKELLGQLLQGKAIVFAENTDTPLYNDLSIAPFVFFKAIDKRDVFTKAGQFSELGLIDRDYLSDTERQELLTSYPFLRILPYYSIENLLYHPDNLEEYYSSHAKPFDKNAYKAALTAAKNKAMRTMLLGLSHARRGYPFYKENNASKKLDAFNESPEVIAEMLESDDFETFYKVFPAKNYGTQLAERQNIPRTDLAKTKWFRGQIEAVLNP